MDVACRAYYQQQNDVTLVRRHQRSGRLTMDYGTDDDDDDVYEEIDDDDSDVDDFDYEDVQLGESSVNRHRSVGTVGSDGDDDDFNSEESGVSPKMVTNK